jgi:hypothetical protein
MTQQNETQMFREVWNAEAARTVTLLESRPASTTSGLIPRVARLGNWHGTSAKSTRA